MQNDNNAYISRNVEEQLAASLKNNKVLFVVGPRQVGKTTMIKRLPASCQPVFLNMDIPVDRDRLRAASSLEPKRALRQLGASRVLIIDEAHRYPGVGRLVKGWYDADTGVKVILLGSSSVGLLDLAAAELTGRNEKIWLTPLMFSEAVATTDWFVKEQLEHFWRENFTEQTRSLLEQLMVFGSYPESYRTANSRDYLQNLVADHLLKDIWQKSLVRSSDAVRRLLQLLAYQVGSEVAVTEIGQQLGASRQTVERYLELLEQSFIIFRLPAYATNKRKEISKSKKYYFWDTGVRNAVINEFGWPGTRTDTGALWENWVIAEFMKLNLTQHQHREIFFWRNRANAEIDLVIKDGSNLIAYEMKWSGRKRATLSFTNEYGVKPRVVNPPEAAAMLLAAT